MYFFSSIYARWNKLIFYLSKGEYNAMMCFDENRMQTYSLIIHVLFCFVSIFHNKISDFKSRDSKFKVSR